MTRIIDHNKSYFILHNVMFQFVMSLAFSGIFITLNKGYRLDKSKSAKEMPVIVYTML